MVRRIGAFLFLVSVTTMAEAFYPPSIILGGRARQYGVCGAKNWQLFAGSGFWKQRPGESDKDFFKRISQAASSAESFASASFGDGKNENSNAKLSEEEDNGDGTQGTKKRGGYQRAEDWDAEQKERKANGEMTWEERVQFEGQRQGNRFKQNEILRNNIKWGR